MRRRRREPERGYALLFVFVMAAFVAISLYMEMPRVLFEAQRAKEQLLIDRGNEYKRAIKVYVRKNQGRYPSSIDALVETNDIHFLRKKFKDPITGKDEWRLIHVGPGGLFPDSLTQAPPKSNLNASSSSSSETDEPTQQALLLQRQRPSERSFVVVGSMSQMGGEQAQDQPQPGQQPAPQPVQQQPGMQIVGSIQGGAYPPQPGQAQVPGQATPYPTQNVPGLPGPYGQQVQAGVAGPGAGMPPSGPGTMTGTGPLPPGAGPRGSQGSQMFTPVTTSFTAQDPQTAQQMINAMIRSGGSGSGTGSTIFGGLIAGVASQSEFEGIKTLDGRSKYKEWEFIYDMRKEMMPGMGTGQRGLQSQQPKIPGDLGR